MLVTRDGARRGGARWRVGTVEGELSVREEGRDGRGRKKGRRSARTLRAMGGLLGVAGVVWLGLASSAFAAGRRCTPTGCICRRVRSSILMAGRGSRTTTPASAG